LGTEEVVTEVTLLPWPGDELGATRTWDDREREARFEGAEDAKESLRHALATDEPVGPFVLAKLPGSVLMGATVPFRPGPSMVVQTVGMPRRGNPGRVRWRDPSSSTRNAPVGSGGPLRRGRGSRFVAQHHRQLSKAGAPEGRARRGRRNRFSEQSFTPNGHATLAEQPGLMAGYESRKGNIEGNPSHGEQEIR
jgi:hypothetical protein